MNLNPFAGIGAGLNDFYQASQVGDLPYTNPASAAAPYFNKIQPYLQGNYDPYRQQGQQAYGQLNPQYNNLTGMGQGLQQQYTNMAQNPGQSLNAIGQNYHQSPGYQFNVQQATNAANNAAAAGGMAGSPQEQQYLATTVSGLANQDYNNWLGQATGMQNQGLQGQTGLYGMGLQGQQHLYDTGYNANNELSQSIANALMSQGSLAYAGQNNENQFRDWQDMQQSGLEGGGLQSIFGSLFGGGGGDSGGSGLSAIAQFLPSIFG